MNTTGTSNTFSSSLTASRPREAVGELDVGEDQAGFPVLGQRHRVGMGAGDADHVVAEIFHQALEVHRDKRLVLDDQHVGGDLGGHFAAGGIGEFSGLGDVGAEDVGDFLLGKTLQRQQQERLAGQRRYVGESRAPTASAGWRYRCRR